ncbi:hypothetical protein B0H13DRAFT_2303282 [Mycena leptocephala]|nr:hypothetical protein B0H13DRAFT_2303282 [Mycena leptocephala]
MWFISSFFLSLADTITGIIYASRPDPRPTPRAPRRRKAKLAKGQTYPDCTVLPTRTLTAAFSVLPLDVVLEVLSWSSPKDLQGMRLVCRTFCRLLNSNKYLWRLARAHLGMGFILPAASAAAGVTEPALASFIFNPAPCTVCGRMTGHLPFSFSLGIRFCSISCAGYLLRMGPENIDKNKGLVITAPALLFPRPDISDSDNGSLAMYDALPYLEGSGDARWYRPSDVQKALNDYAKAGVDRRIVVDIWRRRALEIPAFMELSETLLAGAVRYRLKRGAVFKKNQIFVRDLTKKYNLTIVQLAASPTFARQVNAFMRDSAMLTTSAWLTIRDVALAEVRARMSPDGNPITCSLCKGRRPRHFKVDRLQAHIEAKHPDEHVAMELPENRTKRRCSLCPGSERLFNIRAMKRHLEDAHLAVRSDL